MVAVRIWKVLTFFFSKFLFNFFFFSGLGFRLGLGLGLWLGFGFEPKKIESVLNMRNCAKMFERQRQLKIECKLNKKLHFAANVFPYIFGENAFEIW